jgi:hypothetical protein
MAKRSKRWPIWKIAAATAACGVACPVLLWLSTVVDEWLKQPSAPGGSRTSPMSVSSVLMMLAVAAALLAVLSAIWLVARIRDARTPDWKRRKSKKRS